MSLLGAAYLLAVTPAHADNPIVQHVYTADPAPVVYGDAVYLCTSHDEDVTVDGFFTMNDWRVFSSKDMVNWTDHGSPLSYKTFSWAKANHSWAPHCVQRNGKYYVFVPVSDAIGVAVGDSPIGPFRDAIGKPLLSNYQYIDPTVFVDSDGQAYLYFGNPKLWYVKLNEDMISYSGQVQEIPMTTASFGQRNGDKDRATLYEEGPWFYKRNDVYHMVFASGPLPETISYATSTGPTGPWSYKGQIMSNQSGHAFTNHSGVVDFKGHSYFFYHTQELPGGGGYKRSVAVEEFSYKADGSFPTINKTKEGVKEPVTPLNPYERVEGETIAWESGIEIDDCSEGGRAVSSIDNGDYIKVKSVDFRTGATSFSARVAAAGSGGTIELHLDSMSGTLIGTCKVSATGGAQMWQTSTCDVMGADGVKDLYLVFKGSGSALFGLNYWQFVPKDPLPTGSGGTSGTGGSGGGQATGGAGAGGTLQAGGNPNGGALSNGGSVTERGGGGGVGGQPQNTGGASSGGSSSGGASGGGTAPIAGAPSFGGVTSSGGIGGGKGGNPGSGGTPTGNAGSPPVDSEANCGCVLPGGRAASTPSLPLAAAALLAFARRRRRS